MSERPLILFPGYENAEKASRHGGPEHFHRPSHERQVERLSPKFADLQRALSNGHVTVQQDAENIEVEYTLVLEVAGNLSNFDVAVRHLQSEHQGIEWLFELIDDDGANDEDFYTTKANGESTPENNMTYKYFCVLTNQRALSAILALWEHFTENQDYEFPRGQTGLKNVFQTLKDIHRWGPEERFEETGILDAWQYDLQNDDLENVRCEIELFFRKSENKRTEAQNRVENAIRDVGGSIIAQSCISDIEYHALLVSIPRSYAEEILADQNVALLNLDQIMFVKPTGQSIVSSSNEVIEYSREIETAQNILDDPIIALFDGLPQENHPLLSDLITVDDPDNISSLYQIKDCIHGTSMASLIARGDLEEHDEAVTRKIYVRPIMKPYATLDGESLEFLPDDVLIVDKIHKAVCRLFEDNAGKVSPNIRVINLSIGIGDRLFYNMISPLAKLLDWLSFKYRVLFVVSAGNHNLDKIDLGMPFSSFKLLSDVDKHKQVIRILNRDSRSLKILAPSESMNSLTIGAVFQDSSNVNINSRQLLPSENGHLSLISSIGSGINRSIKPDIVFNGGRNVLLQDPMNNNCGYWRKTGNNSPGILSAKPLNVRGGTASVGYSFGTSDSAALISHNAAICYEILNNIFNNETGSDIPKEHAALLLKAMLVHGAKWDNNANDIRDELNLPGRAADEVHRWIGYGYPDIQRVKECVRNRITLIGYGELSQDTAHIYGLPLPFDFHIGKIVRCLTVTLASFTPIKPTTQKYRSSQLWVTLDDNGKKIFPDRLDVSDKAAVRGTIQHERFAGERAVVWDEDDSVFVKVNCRADACKFIETIPYALFCTFEVAPEINIDVYQSVREKLAIRASVTSQ